MFTKSTPREDIFAFAPSKKLRSAATLRLQVARDEVQLAEMGVRIKELRESNGYKQPFVADKAGIGLRQYQNWEAGKHEPEQENLERLAALYGVTPKYILRGDTPELFAANGAPEDLGEQLAKMNERLAAIERSLETIATARAVVVSRRTLQQLRRELPGEDHQQAG